MITFYYTIISHRLTDCECYERNTLCFFVNVCIVYRIVIYIKKVRSGLREKEAKEIRPLLVVLCVMYYGFRIDV